MSFQITNYHFCPTYLTQCDDIYIEDQEWSALEESWDYQPGIAPENSIEPEEDSQQASSHINPAKALTILTSVGYPASFFMPKQENSNIKNEEWEIRNLASEYNLLGMYAEAAKLCIKLFVNSLNTPKDSKLLNTVVYNLINKPYTGINNFNFNEIQAIISSCKNAELFDKTEIHNNNELLKHLIFKTNSLVEAIEGHKKKAKLLLKSKADNTSSIAMMLPPEVIQMIALKYLDIIADIGQTPVDISRSGSFPAIHVIY